MKFKPIILEAEANRELRWRGNLPIPGLFIGEHIFTKSSAVHSPRNFFWFIDSLDQKMAQYRY